MSRFRLELRDEALDDLVAARGWYALRAPGRDQDLLSEIDEAFEAILDAPARWPKFHKDMRRFVLARFPYGVFYVVGEDVVTVVAVGHHRRRPMFWLDR